jgi:hypothetical protein
MAFVLLGPRPFASSPGATRCQVPERLTEVDQQGEQKYVPLLPTAPFFEKNRWHKVQARIDFEADRLRIWMNDVLHTDSDVTLARIGELTTGRAVSLDDAAGPRFTEARQGATWGGGNGYPAPAGSRVRSPAPPSPGADVVVPR